MFAQVNQQQRADAAARDNAEVQKLIQGNAAKLDEVKAQGAHIEEQLQALMAAVTLNKQHAVPAPALGKLWEVNPKEVQFEVVEDEDGLQAKKKAILKQILDARRELVMLDKREMAVIERASHVHASDGERRARVACGLRLCGGASGRRWRRGGRIGSGSRRLSIGAGVGAAGGSVGRRSRGIVGTRGGVAQVGDGLLRAARSARSTPRELHRARSRHLRPLVCRSGLSCSAPPPRAMGRSPTGRRRRRRDAAAATPSTDRAIP